MTNFLYSIYDLKAETFLPVMEGKNDEHAKRTVAQAIQQGIPVAQYPEDYELFRLAKYDPQTGYLTQDTRPERVASILQIMAQYSLSAVSAGPTEVPPLTNGQVPETPREFDRGIEFDAEAGEAAADGDD